ncbi:MAG TPA: PepSY domain-containing protein [Gemmatimonadaceae bacterium]|nr:PepSY domain-containing protein [Gemmatimonadaceae bacterium]
MMRHQFPLAAVLLAAFAIPAAAQQTTTSDTTAKSPSGATVTTSNGALADSAKATNATAPTGANAAAPAAPMAAPAPADSAKPAEGQVAPHAAAKVDVKVAESLASTVKVSGDSAFALARASVPGTDVSSADLEMKDGRLVYEVKLVGDNQSAYEVHVDAMTGEVTKDKRYGGAKALIEHANESKKLEEAKSDSVEKKP